MRLLDKEEGVTIQVVALNAPLRILEDDLDVSSVGGVEDVRRGRDRCAGRRWLVIDTVVLEHLVGDAVILRELQWGGGFHMRHAVEREAALAVDEPDRAGELDGSGDVDATVVVGALGVGPGGAGREVPSERPPLVEGPRPADRRRRQLG
ncbi:unnamed protein product [Musa acuminata var. zebrina]